MKQVVADSSEELWHKRLGHMSERAMHILVDKKLRPKVKGAHSAKCVVCLVEKQNKVVVHSRPPRRREVALELLHTGVCYVDARSHRVRQYFVTFIEDYPKPSEVVGFRSKVKGPSTVTL